MYKVRTLLDKELGLLNGPQRHDLSQEDPTKDFYGDDRYFRADGQRSCKNQCESLFSKGDEKTLREACKSTCKAKCKLLKCSWTPSRASVCTTRGLNPDCTEKGVGDFAAPTAQGTQAAPASPPPANQTMSMGMKIGLGVGALLLIGGVVYIIKRNKG